MSYCTICMKDRDCETCNRTIRSGEMLGVETNERRFRDGTIYRDVKVKCHECFEWSVMDLMRLLLIPSPEARISSAAGKPTMRQTLIAIGSAIRDYLFPLMWDVRSRSTGELISRHHTKKGAIKAMFSRGRSAARNLDVVRRVYRMPASNYMAMQTILMNRAMRNGPRPYRDRPFLSVSR